MGLFGKKKSRSNDGGHYDVTSDPNMTRWPQRFCDHCGETTLHKVSRNSRGSSDATSQCKTCMKWEEVSW